MRDQHDGPPLLPLHILMVIIAAAVSTFALVINLIQAFS